MQDRFARYIKILAISLLGGFAVIGGFNWVIDPYGELGKNWIGCYTDNDRQRVKAIRSFPHDAVLTGSSRTLHINPDDLCRYKFYNASIPSALPEEIYYYLEKYVKKEKLVVIGLDLYMFNESAYPLEKMKTWPDRTYSNYEYLLGWNVLADSVKAVYLREYVRKIRPSNGFYPISNDPAPDIKKYQAQYQIFLNYSYKNYHVSEARLQYMRSIKQLLETRHIKYIVFVNPMQQDHWGALHQSGNYENFLQLIGRLKEIFPDLTYFPEGIYSQRELFQNSDPSHYLPFLGATIVNDLLGCGDDAMPLSKS